MQVSKLKVINNVFSKTIIIKIGVFISLATYWGIILIGTVITFS
jgi:hypothetical protein